MDKEIKEIWLKREVARFNHDVGKHKQDIGCTSCHINITREATLKEKTLDIPLPTCGGPGGSSTSCHITTKPSKVWVNDEVTKKLTNASFQCVRCHVGFGDDPIPKTHTDAVPPPAKK